MSFKFFVKHFQGKSTINKGPDGPEGPAKLSDKEAAVHGDNEDGKGEGKIYVKGTDWHLYMLSSFFQKLGGVHLKDEGLFEFPLSSKPFLKLNDLNTRIRREELRARLPLGSGKKKKKLVLPSASSRDFDRKFQTSAFQRFKQVPFCCCHATNTRTEVCRFCEFACCDEAVMLRMQDDFSSCWNHGKVLLEHGFLSGVEQPKTLVQMQIPDLMGKREKIR